jgi:hypothetical protein
MVYTQPSIEIYGIKINEPVTTATDLLITAVCLYAFFRLNKIPKQNNIHTYLKYYFLSMGFATAIGGLIGHGFFYLFSFEWKLPGWLTSMISIALVERAAILYAKKLVPGKVGKIFAWLNIIELLIFVTLTFTTLNFFFVEAHAAYGLMVVVFSFSLVVYLKTKSKGSRFFLIAIAFSAVGALFFMNKWGIGPWFNHFDISHIFLAFSAWFFYKGSMLIIFDPLSSPEPTDATNG